MATNVRGEIPARLHWQIMRSRIWEVQRDADLRAGSGPMHPVFEAISALASAVDELLGAELARCAREPRMQGDGGALDRIAVLLSGREWGGGTLSEVADIVRSTGRPVGSSEGGNGHGRG